MFAAFLNVSTQHKQTALERKQIKEHDGDDKKKKSILILMINYIFYCMLEEGEMDPNGSLLKKLHFVIPPSVRTVEKSC